jgi:hypothetical protein
VDIIDNMSLKIRGTRADLRRRRRGHEPNQHRGIGRNIRRISGLRAQKGRTHNYSKNPTKDNDADRRNADAEPEQVPEHPIRNHVLAR